LNINKRPPASSPSDGTKIRLPSLRVSPNSLFSKSEIHEAVSFELEFLDDHLTGSGQRIESLMNVAGPYYVTIEPNRKKFIRIKELLDLSDMPNHIQGGGSSFIHIKIIDGETARIL